MLKEIAILSPIFITLFWCLVLLFQSTNRHDPKFKLGVFMLFAFALYCSHAVFFNNQYHLYSYFEALYLFSMLSIYPLYYNYTISLASKSLTSKNKVDYFLPAVLFSLFALVITVLLSPEDRILYVKETLIEKNLKDLTFNSLIGLKGIAFFTSRIFFLFQVAYFGVLVFRFTAKHNHQLEDYYSNTEGKTLSWVKIINVVILIAATASVIFALIGRSYFLQNEVSLLFPSFIFSAFFFFIGYNGSQQIQVINDIEEEQFVFNFSDSNDDLNYDLKTQIADLFANQKVYKNSDLRITTVSEQLNTNRTYISKLINEEFNVTFSDFVNTFRVEEAKKLLTNTDNQLFTMEYIAEKSGFGSVNSFSRVFKKAFGTSPGNYRDKHS